MRSFRWFTSLLPIAALGLAAACGDDGGGISDGDPNEGSGGGASTTRAGDPNSNLNIDPVDSTIVCDSFTGDGDGDGYSYEEGDCNDCDANANPGALDVPGNDVDEDCNGIADDDLHLLCDADLTFNSNDALDAARAIGLCKESDPEKRSWGVVSAKYTLIDGSTPPSGITNRFDVGHGLLEDFGPNVPAREGSRLLALSTGVARDLEDAGYLSPAGQQHLTPTLSAPEGFPIPSTSCPSDISLDRNATDSVVLEVTLRTPSNAKSMSFDFDFYTFEFPDYICTEFNDNFIVLMDPPPANATQGNISFDTEGNPVNVNAGFLSVCNPNSMAGGKVFPCDLGTDQLQGTGFEAAENSQNENRAATGWLTTTVPVEASTEITLKFMIWDAGLQQANGEGDYFLDSTVLIDNLRFSAEAASRAVTTPITK